MVWKKGESGNPRGMIVPSDLQAARRMNKFEFERIANKYLYSTKKEIEQCLIDPSLSAVDIAVIKVIAEAIKHGDVKRLAFLFDRLIGKPKETIELTRNDPLAAYNDISDEQLAERLKSYGIAVNEQ
jgi:hypothetical protein